MAVAVESMTHKSRCAIAVLAWCQVIVVMAFNNKAVARAMYPSQSRCEEIACRSGHTEITVKMAQVPDSL
eukprot:15239528-Ditylum_brightwellii.AAC.1